MGLASFNRARRIKAEQETPKIEVNEELQLLRERGKELGIPRATQMGEAKLLEAIASKEEELKIIEEEKQLKDLQELRAKATELGIESVEEKDAETLMSEVAALGE